MHIYPPGSLINGRYEVASRPMMGGMGVVYLCYDRQEGRPVALKTFRSELLSDRTARDRFLREGTTWVTLKKHPNIVSCYGIERIGDGTEMYLILELIAGEQKRKDASLRSWMSPGSPMSIQNTLLFGLQIIRGMEYATRAIPGFVHRDLKPENILIGADRLWDTEINRARVTDFGLANVFIGDQHVKHSFVGNESEKVSNRTQLTYGLVGTPLYMAPEQWKNQSISLQTDIYAFGCILYEMLCGQSVATGDTLESLEKSHCHDIINRVPGDVPGSIQEIILGCLRKEINTRYKNWKILEQALDLGCREIIGFTLESDSSNMITDRKENIQQGWALNTLGLSYIDIGKPKTSLPYFERAKEIADAETDLRLQSSSINHIGLAYLETGDAHDAISYFITAVELAQKAGALHGESAALGNLGLAYRTIGQLDQSIKYHQLDLEIAQKIHDRQGEGTTLHNLGMAYLAKGEPSRALEFHEKSLGIAWEVGDRLGQCRALGGLANVHSALGDIEKTIQYLQQVLQIAQEIGSLGNQQAAFSGLGVAYATVGDLKHALVYYERSLACAREERNRRSEGNALNNIGATYADMREPLKSLEVYQEAIKIFQEIDDQVGEGRSLGGLGLASFISGNSEQAIHYLQKALMVNREANDKREEGHTLGILGAAFHSIGDYSHAEKSFVDSLKIKEDVENWPGVAETAFNLGVFMVEQKRFDKALNYSEYAMKIWTRLGFEPHAQKANQLIAYINQLL